MLHRNRGAFTTTDKKLYQIVRLVIHHGLTTEGRFIPFYEESRTNSQTFILYGFQLALRM